MRRIVSISFGIMGLVLGVGGSGMVGCANGNPGGGEHDSSLFCNDDSDCPAGWSCQGNVCVTGQVDAGTLDAEPPRHGRINVFPDPIQFGPASLHVDWVQTATIANTGDGDLTVSQIAVLENDSLDEFSLSVMDATPIVLPPAGSVTVDIVLHPEDGELDVAKLQVTSDDPDNPVVTVDITSEWKGDPTLSMCVLDDSSTDPEPFTDCVVDAGTGDPLIDYGVVSFGMPVAAVVAIRNAAAGNAPLRIDSVEVVSGDPAVTADFGVRLFAYDTDGVTEVPVSLPVWLSAGDPSQSIPPEDIFAEVTFGANIDGIISNTRLEVGSDDPAGRPVPISAAVSGCPQDYWDLNGDPGDGCEYHCVYQGPEQCGSGADENCNGDQDEEGASGCTFYYRDADGDGWGLDGDSHCTCQPDVPNDYDATQGGDCDDANNLVNPAAVDVCDGVDNDCDQSTDEDLGSTTCGQGVCVHTVQNCVGGVPQTCDPLQGASAEVCDGQDNDCNGQSDDGLGSTTCGQGVCGHTVQNCVGGTPQFCNPFDGSGPDVCNGQDDDCDGSTDEDLGSTTCGQGVCHHTVLNCVNGNPQTCDPMEGSSLETCNGLDDDCDGSTDEDLGSTTCGQGVCLHTVQNCVGGTPQSCDPLQGASTEVCDGQDNNCNGQVDEITQTDVDNCGSCGNQCTNAHGSTACVASSCTPSCLSGYGDCNGDPDDGCETSTTTTSNCGGCGNPCALANAGESCSTGSCQITSCSPGYCNSDGVASNGCEYDLDTNPSCSSYTNLGSVAGDTGSDTITWSGKGERWFRVRVDEDDDGCDSLGVQAKLYVPAGEDYDLYIYCSSCSGGGDSSALGSGSTDQVNLYWDDECFLGVPTGSDQGRYIYIKVSHYSVRTCANYTLEVKGNIKSGTSCG